VATQRRTEGDATDGPLTYAWGEHVGELELHLEAAEEEGVFVAAVRALEEVLGDDGGGAREWFGVSAEGDDRAVLLAAWIEELVFLAEHDGVIPVTVRDLALERRSIGAQIGGYRGRPPHLVKAVTYHRLTFEPGANGWRANVVLDV
jgi:SHS2 domain-containing protein